MARRKINQTEAWELFHKVKRLEAILNEQKRYWAKNWPEGVNIASAEINIIAKASIKTARALDHAVVASIENDKVYFHALPLPKN